jgi:mannitol-1-phosphate 5-dehydrogenase
LLTVNTGHSAIAYLGYARGRETIHAALEDDDVRYVASKVLEETGLLLAYKYGFDPEELREYRQKVLARFGNPRISDEVTRVARAPFASSVATTGSSPRSCASSRWATRRRIWPRAVLGFDYPQDEEAVELQETIHAEGERATLAHYATIAEDHPLVDLVMERSDRIRE